MSRPAHTPRRRAAAAFTLIEMIGVLAIMAIVASVLVPNVLRTMDRAAVKAEAETLKALGEQVKLYTKINGTPPSSASWTSDIGTLADLAPVDIATNRRGKARYYLIDPTPPTPAPRIMLLSSMRPDLPIVTTGATTAAQFQSLWQTANNAVPTAASWGDWTTWRAVANGGDYLLIERVNLRGIYQTNPAAVIITFNITEATVPGSYSFRPPGAAMDSGPFALVPAQNFTPGTILTLYSNGAPNYTYAVGTTPRTFDLQGANWIPQP